MQQRTCSLDAVHRIDNCSHPLLSTMCGIWAYLVSGNLEDLQPHFKKIEHRGPDNTSFIVHKDTGISLGFARLSVINLHANGMQPFVSAGVTLICNGEIFNCEDLSKDMNVSDLGSDVEIINYMLSSSDSMSSCVRKLDGEFAFFAILSNGSLIAARDSAGVRPLFYGVDVDDEVIAFSSEAKGLMNAPRIKRVHVFPPGQIWTARRGFETYSDVFFPREVAARTVHDELRRLLEASVKKRLVHSDVPVALLCSGGLDSSLILAIAHELKCRQLHAFSIEYHDGFARSPDALYAQLLTSHLGVKHTRVTFNMDDVQKHIQDVIKTCETYDPNTIRAAVPMFVLAKYIKEHTPFKVVLSGEGADEVFCGYNYFGKASIGEDIEQESERLVKNIHMFDLLRADRCFAAFGLELRVPFLDTDVLRYSMALPGKLRGFKNGVEKALLRESFASMSALSCARIIDRQKERLSDGCGTTYVPQLLNWMGEGRNTLEEKLSLEKESYLKTFDAIYPNSRHLITARVLPEWVHASSGPQKSSLGF